jgi:N utilization substance protein B
MANRHLSRSIVMQTLFEGDLRNLEARELQESLARNAAEFAPGADDNEFIEGLLDGVVKKKKIIDEIIEKAAPEWPIDKIAAVDRNVLRIGLYELLFSDHNEVPPKVAINEAIELAKSFGGENSGRFVNGVLGAIYKEMGEPGKDQVSKRKQNDDVDLEELPVDQKAGAVVYSIDNDGTIRLAMVHDVFGYWTLSKGGGDEGETPEQTVVREIKEEMSLDIAVEAKLGENEYIANHPERGKVRKQVQYYLGRSEYTPVQLEQDSGGLDDVRWFELDEIARLTMYDDITQMITKAIGIITKK